VGETANKTKVSKLMGEEEKNENSGLQINQPHNLP